jgi:hypothetical protein
MFKKLRREWNLNGTHQLLVYAHCVHILGGINTIRNTETLLDGRKEVDLDVNAERTKHVFMFQSATCTTYS